MNPDKLKALVVASNQIAEELALTAESWAKVHKEFEAKLSAAYGKNETLNKIEKQQAAAVFTAPASSNHNAEPRLQEMAQQLNKQTNKLIKRNNQIQKVTQQLEVLGHQSLPQDVAQKVSASQKEILDTLGQNNQIALEAQKLFKTQALLFNKPTANADPKQQAALDNTINKLVAENKKLKGEVKKQVDRVNDINNDISQGTTPRLK